MLRISLTELEPPAGARNKRKSTVKIRRNATLEAMSQKPTITNVCIEIINRKLQISRDR